MTLALPVAAPGSAQRAEWDGRTGAGDVSPNGRYRMRVSAPDGTARTIGCHLHFEIRSQGRPIDPAPELHRWDGRS